MLAHWTSRFYDFRLEDDSMDEFTAKMVFALAFADEVRIIHWALAPGVSARQ